MEQAKGIVAERLKVDMDIAFGMIRTHARNHGIPLSKVAEDLVRGSLSATELTSASKGRRADRTKGLTH